MVTNHVNQNNWWLTFQIIQLIHLKLNVMPFFNSVARKFHFIDAPHLSMLHTLSLIHIYKMLFLHNVKTCYFKGDSTLIVLILLMKRTLPICVALNSWTWNILRKICCFLLFVHNFVQTVWFHDYLKTKTRLIVNMCNFSTCVSSSIPHCCEYMAYEISLICREFILSF